MEMLSQYIIGGSSNLLKKLSYIYSKIAIKHISQKLFHTQILLYANNQRYVFCKKGILSG